MRDRITILVIIIMSLSIYAQSFMDGGCAKEYTYSNSELDEWIFSTNTFEGYTRTYIGNGYMGIQIPIEGNGWTPGLYPLASENRETPVESRVAGIYNKRLGIDENPHLVTIPRWSAVGFNDGSNWFDHTVGECKSYLQVLNMYDGYVNTKYVWDDDGKITDINITFFLSRSDPHLALIRYSIIPRYSGYVSFMSILEAIDNTDFDIVLGGLDASGASWLLSKTSQTNIIIAEASVIDVFPVTAFPMITVPSVRQISQIIQTNAEDGEEIVLYKYVAVYTSLESSDPVSDALQIAATAKSVGFEKLFSEHKDAWHNIWKTRIKVHGDNIKVQRAINANMFYLYCSIREDQNHSIAPMGLSGGGYGGHIFWDAEFWIYPSLLMLQPDFAKSVVQYRYDKMDGARRKAVENGYEGLMYPWESADTGDEVTPSWADTGKYEHHITADVAIAQWWYYLATGDQKWLENFGMPVILGTAEFWASRVTYNQEKDRYEIKKVICADEYSGVVDNNGFTNAAATRNIEIAIKLSQMFGKEYPSKWDEIIRKMYIPFDSANQFHPEYEGYSGQKIKQADVQLLVYPLEWNMSRNVKINDLYYYDKKMDWSGGPAMSASIFSIVSSEAGLRRLAYDYFKKSYEPNVKPPFNAFSEAPSNNNFCFLTGAGGSLQSLLYGFTGFRWREGSLFFNPSLPPQWTSLSLINISWHGFTYNISIFREYWEIKINQKDMGSNQTVRVETSKVSFNAISGHLYRINGTSVIDLSETKPAPQIKKKFIPGFEIPALAVAIGAAILLWDRKGL